VSPHAEWRAAEGAVVSNGVSNPPWIPVAKPKSSGIIIRASGFESLLRHFVKAPQQRGLWLSRAFRASIRRITRPPGPALAGGERQRGGHERAAAGWALDFEPPA